MNYISNQKNKTMQTMSQEEYDSTPPGKTMMEMIKEHTDKTIDMTIDQCIKVVNDELCLSGSVEALLNCKKIIERLTNLKTKK